MTGVYFFTGFPGFIATQLIQKLGKEYAGSQFIVLVHPTQVAKAEEVVKRLVADGYGEEAQFEIIAGDITVPSLGIDAGRLEQLRAQVTHVFHLAAIYDLAVPQNLAERVNVTGTRNVNEWVRTLHHLQRYVYFSTAYVSGTRTGRIYEQELVKGQGFKNHYEATKYEAEVLVQRMLDDVPTTIIRPGITLGHSQTGATVKFDGPYFIMRFLDKFARLPIPYVGRGDAYINLVPIDYIVDATTYLSHALVGTGKVYHLTDPNPYKAKEAYRMITEALLGKKPAFTLPAQLIYAALSIGPFRRWVGVERETIEYFRLRAEYDATEATRDLADSDVHCPDFAEYIPIAVQYYKAHRDDADKRIDVQ